MIATHRFFYQNTAADCLIDQVTATTKGSWRNNAGGAAAPVSVDSVSATVGYQNSHTTAIVPTSSCTLLLAAKFANATPYNAYMWMGTVLKLRNSEVRVFWDDAGAGNINLMEPGWNVFAVTITSPSSMSFACVGRRDRIMASARTSAGNITANASPIILGGAGYADSYGNWRLSEFRYYNSALSLDTARAEMAEMRQRMIGLGLNVF